MAFVRNGDVFERDLRSGALTQVTRSNEDEATPQWSSDGNLQFRVGHDWYQLDAPAAGVPQAALRQGREGSGRRAEADALRDLQLRLIATLKNDQRQTRRRARAERAAGARPTRPARRRRSTWATTSPSTTARCRPDGRWLLVVTAAKGADEGHVGKMPQVRDRIGLRGIRGRAHPRRPQRAAMPHTLWLVDLTRRRCSDLTFDTLPGIADRSAGGDARRRQARSVEGQPRGAHRADGDDSGPAIRWSADGRRPR